jgi:type IV pilus assembly protein PilE
MTTRNKQSGFTLIEVIIVVAIVGILAAIAYPSYQDSVRKSRRADGRAVLIELAQWMERNYTEAYRYDQDSAGNAIVLPFNQAPKDGGAAFYNINLTAAAASTFVLTAAPTGAQASDKCGSLTLNQAGQKNISGADAGVAVTDCW